jgi:DNA-binding transcriptional LysR family regulator
MDTRFLSEFIGLATTLNFSRAARALHVSQSSLSRHIAELERSLGVKLFNRESPLALTYSGEVLLNEARSVLDAEEHLESAVKASKDVDQAVLRVFDWRYAPRALSLINPALADIVRDSPGYRVVLRPVAFGSSEEQEVLDGTLDVGILARTTLGMPVFPPDDELARRPLLDVRQRLVFYLDIDDPLARAPALSFADLRQHSFIAAMNAEHENVAPDVTAICRAFGFEPHIRLIKVESKDDFCLLDLTHMVVIGLEDYREAFESGGHVKMVPCSDDVWVTVYLIYRVDNDNVLLHAFLKRLDLERADPQ